MFKVILTRGFIVFWSMLSSLSVAAEITWRVPSAMPGGSFFYHEFVEKFAKNVELITDGKVEIKPFGAGVVVPVFKLYEAVQDGVVEAGHSTAAFLVNQDPANAIFSGFPGGMSSEATLHWYYAGGGMELLQKHRREKMGLHSFILGMGASEIFAHSHKPIRTTADLEGLKYRTAGAWASILKENFGGVPTVVPGGEVYSLLQRKGVDAVEWTIPSANIKEGYHDIAPYIILPGIHQPVTTCEFFVKAETWDNLPEKLQQQIEAAAKLTTYESYMTLGDADIKALMDYKKTKVKIIELDDEVVEEIRQAGRNWAQKKADEISQSGDDSMKKILEAYTRYQQDWSANAGYLVKDRATSK